MANGFMVINSRFNPLSYEEMVRPLAAYTEEYNAQEAAYDELANNAAQWERLADSQIDQDAYRRYKDYSTVLQQAAEALASEGLKPGSRKAVQKARRQYVEQIIPIEQAYRGREELSKYQRDLLARDPSYLIDRSADQISLNELISNPQLSPSIYSGALLEKSASQAASALARSMRDNPRKWNSILGGQYSEARSRYGYTASEIQAALSGNGPRELVEIVEQSMAPFAGWTNERAKEEALSYIGRALWNAIGEEKYDTLRVQLPQAPQSSGPEAPQYQNAILPPVFGGRTITNEVLGGNKDIITGIVNGTVPDEVRKAQDEIGMYEYQLREMEKENPGLVEYAESHPGTSWFTPTGRGDSSLPESGTGYVQGANKYNRVRSKLAQAQAVVNKWNKANNNTREALLSEYASLSDDPEEVVGLGSNIENAYSSYVMSVVPINVPSDVYENFLTQVDSNNIVAVKPNGKEKPITRTIMDELLKHGKMGISEDGFIVKDPEGNSYRIRANTPIVTGIEQSIKSTLGFLRSWKNTPFINSNDLSTEDFIPLTDNLYGVNMRVQGVPVKGIYEITPRGEYRMVYNVPVDRVGNSSIDVDVIRQIVGNNINSFIEQLSNLPSPRRTNSDLRNIGYSITDDSYYGYGD